MSQYTCRAEGCNETFGSRKGRNAHEGQRHPDEPVARYQREQWLREKYDEYGTLRKVAEAAGVSKFTIGRYMDIYDIELRGRGGRHPDEEYLDDAIAGYVMMGEWPTWQQYEFYAEHSPQSVNDRWESWSALIEDAKERYEETHEEWPDPGEVVG